jgi:hypothetical protein
MTAGRAAAPGGRPTAWAGRRHPRASTPASVPVWRAVIEQPLVVGVGVVARPAAGVVAGPLRPHVPVVLDRLDRPVPVLARPRATAVHVDAAYPRAALVRSHGDQASGRPGRRALARSARGRRRSLRRSECRPVRGTATHRTAATRLASAARRAAATATGSARAGSTRARPGRGERAHAHPRGRHARRRRPPDRDLCALLAGGVLSGLRWCPRPPWHRCPPS